MRSPVCDCQTRSEFGADSHSSAAVLPFPQDLTLARVRVAEARQQLAELEDQFTQQVQQMHEADGNM